TLARALRRADSAPSTIADEALAELGAALDLLGGASHELAVRARHLEEGRRDLTGAVCRLDALVKALPGSFLVTDEIGLITRCTSHEEGLFDPDQVRGTPLAMLVHQAERAAFQDWLLGFAGGGAATAATVVRWLLADRSRSLPCRLTASRNAAIPRGPD